MRSTRVVLLAAALVLSGCFHYVPAELNRVRPSEKVRLTVTEAQLGRLAGFADGRRGTVEGEFVGIRGDSARIVLRSPTQFHEVAIPTADILGTQRRELDRTKNFLVSASSVGVVGVLAWKGFSGRAGREPGTEGSTDESLIPLFSFRVPAIWGILGGGR